MEFGFQPRDRRQVRRGCRTGSPLSHMVASRAACLNRAQGAVRRLYCAHFDNSERPAGVDLCIYCDVRFATDFSQAIWGVVYPRGGLAKWLAGKVFPRTCNRLREIQKSINARKERVRSVASGHEAKIQLRQYTPLDSCFCLHILDRSCRRSIGRASDCFEGSELWMEFVSPSSDRRKNRRERGTRPPL